MLIIFFAVLLLVPIAMFAISRRLRLNPESRGRTAVRTAALFAVGLTIASPFLTPHAVGTGEAYNYSLALADGVTQMRAGEVPPLAGQTEYAFNGRVHPLRNAPYLFYLAEGVDLLTLRSLSFWELQNLSLSLSLIGAIFAGYGALRWGVGCGRLKAFCLASVYGFCPALLVACTMNLFMTVHAAVFVPLAIGACLRHCRHPAVQNDFLLAAALAAAWLAHPPVALWLTLSVSLVRVVILWRNPSWRFRGGLLGAALLGAALAGFVFVSVTTLSSDLAYFPEGPEYVSSLMANIEASFPASILPVSRKGDLLTDLQLGYVGWALLAFTLVHLVRSRTSDDEAKRTQRLAGFALAASALLLLGLTLPVPFLTHWLWEQIPDQVKIITSVWPMQRLYLIATALILFAFALAPGSSLPARFFSQRAKFTWFALAVIWTGWQASSGLARGFALRWSEDLSRRKHLGSNLDLTVTSYAFVQVPSTFVHGVMDPEFEFALLKGGLKTIASPLKAALASAPVVARGGLFRRDGPNGPEVVSDSQKLTLLPGKRYLLTFNFLLPTLTGSLEVMGPALWRAYQLPNAGEAEGFGMGEGHSRSLSIWTSLAQPETVDVRAFITAWPAGLGANSKLADFTLQAVDRDRLPIRLTSLLPLRCTVDAPEAGCFVSTPRRYIPGYAATVDGRPVRPIRSPDGQVMLPVPQGRSVVEVRYLGPWSVRAAFWLSAVSWLGFFVWSGGRLVGVDWSPAARRSAKITTPVARLAWRHRYWAIGTIGLLSVGIYLVSVRTAYENGVGPIRISFLLPLKQFGRQQPLLVTGRAGAGTNVFINFVDETHIRIGADIWGALFQSDLLPVDYFQIHDVVINSSALYPLDHPKVRSLSEKVRAELRSDFRVELDGHTVLALQHSAYESTLAQVTVGETRIGGSLTQPRFLGEIIKVERLALPQSMVVAHDRSARLELQFPNDRRGITEPLLSIGPDSQDGVCSVTYGTTGHANLARRSANGSVLEAVDVTYDPRRAHVLEFTFGSATEPTPAIPVSWKFDGQVVLGPANPPPATQPTLLTAGLCRTEVAGVETRFTGREIRASLGPGSAAVLPHLKTGPLTLIVTLPGDKTGRQEPLLTTGRTGKGDFAYVIYADDRHVRFAFDHWGVGGATSDPVEIDYRSPHEIEISLGSLYPAEGDDPAWPGVAPDQRQRLKSEMEIRLDGKSVLKAHFPAHPSKPEEITVGLNRIGGSNCDPAFTGEIHEAEQTGINSIGVAHGTP
jgi:hypothetical protein